MGVTGVGKSTLNALIRAHTRVQARSLFIQHAPEYLEIEYGVSSCMPMCVCAFMGYFYKGRKKWALKHYVITVFICNFSFQLLFIYQTKYTTNQYIFMLKL